MSIGDQGRRSRVFGRRLGSGSPSSGVDFPPEPLPQDGRFWFGRMRAIRRLSLAAFWIALLVPPQWLLFRLGLPGRGMIPQVFHYGTCKILGIDVAIDGTPIRNGPVLYLCNHLSYLDISVLGSLLRGSFIAKGEVGEWPVFGMMARLQSTVFVRRDRRRARQDLAEVDRRLFKGDRLILFPEGTSGDGIRVLPFKSTLLEATAGARVDQSHTVPVQPISLALTHVDGIPAGRSLQPYYAWFGDMTLLPHLIAMAGLGRMRVKVTFHPPTSLTEAGNRKTLAAQTHATIADGVWAAQRAPLLG